MEKPRIQIPTPLQNRFFAAERNFTFSLDKNSKNMILFKNTFGAMAEWSNAAVLKTVEPLRVPGVQIPLAPFFMEAW